MKNVNEPMLLIFFVFLFTISFCMHAKNAIVIGASSGMGREIAKQLSKAGYTLGLVARRQFLLETLSHELDGPSYIKQIDVTNANARSQLIELIREMNGLDLIVISISSTLERINDLSMLSPDTVDDNKEKIWKNTERAFDVDCKGFVAMADVAFEFFIKQNHGHFVGISSSAGLIGLASCPDYCGIKACLSTYMQGMRHKMVRDGYNVYVTDVIPGYVAVEYSPLGSDPQAFWEISAEKAGEIIMQGIKEKKKTVYVPSKVWTLSLLKFLPDWLYHQFFNWL